MTFINPPSFLSYLENPHAIVLCSFVLAVLLASYLK